MGDEGGFAPSINSTTEGLDLIVAAIAVRLAFPVCGAQLNENCNARTLTSKAWTWVWPPSQLAPLPCAPHGLETSNLKACLLKAMTWVWLPCQRAPLWLCAGACRDACLHPRQAQAPAWLEYPRAATQNQGHKAYLQRGKSWYSSAPVRQENLSRWVTCSCRCRRPGTRAK